MCTLMHTQLNARLYRCTGAENVFIYLGRPEIAVGNPSISPSTLPAYTQDLLLKWDNSTCVSLASRLAPATFCLGLLRAMVIWRLPCSSAFVFHVGNSRNPDC